MMDNGEVIQVGYTKFTDWNRHQYRVYSTDGINPCLNTCGGGGREPKIVVDMETDKTICLNSKVDGKQPSLQDRIYDVEGCSTAITTSFLPYIAEPRIINPLKGYSDNGWHFEQQVYDGEGIARAVKAGEGSGNIPKVIEPLCSVHPNSHKLEFNPETSIKPISPALRATDYKAPHCVYEPQVESRYRIRKLTPVEVFRLMGVDDKDIDKIQASGISNSQQYKMAGNSIVVDTLYHLFRKMFCETENESVQPTLF